MPFDAEQVRCMGIEPAERRSIVVKSAARPVPAYSLERSAPGTAQGEKRHTGGFS